MPRTAMWFFASELCLSSVKTLYVGKFDYLSGNNEYCVEMKLTVIDIPMSAASPVSPDTKVANCLDLET